MAIPKSNVEGLTYELPTTEKIEMLKQNIASQARKAYNEVITYEMQEAAGATEQQLGIPLRRRENFLIGQKAVEDMLTFEEVVMNEQTAQEEPVVTE